MLTISHKINTADSLSASDRLFCDNLYYEYLAAYNVLEALRASYRNTHLPEKKYQDPFYHELRVLDKHCSELTATIAELNISYVAELEGHFTNAYHIPFIPYEITEECKHAKFEHYHDVVNNIIAQTGTDLAAAGRKCITSELKECLSLRSRIPEGWKMKTYADDGIAIYIDVTCTDPDIIKTLQALSDYPLIDEMDCSQWR